MRRIVAHSRKLASDSRREPRKPSPEFREDVDGIKIIRSALKEVLSSMFTVSGKGENKGYSVGGKGDSVFTVNLQFFPEDDWVYASLHKAEHMVRFSNFHSTDYANYPALVTAVTCWTVDSLIMSSWGDFEKDRSKTAAMEFDWTNKDEFDEVISEIMDSNGGHEEAIQEAVEACCEKMQSPDNRYSWALAAGHKAAAKSLYVLGGKVSGESRVARTFKPLRQVVKDVRKQLILALAGFTNAVESRNDIELQRDIGWGSTQLLREFNSFSRRLQRAV